MLRLLPVLVAAMIATPKLIAGELAAPQKFDFGPGTTATGFTRVVATDRYSAERGFGFEVADALADFSNFNSNLQPSGDGVSSSKPFSF